MCLFSHKSLFIKTFEEFLKLLSKKKLNKKICKKLFDLDKSMVVYIPFCFMDFNMWDYYIDLVKINHKKFPSKIINDFTSQLKTGVFDSETLNNIIQIQPVWIGMIPTKLITYGMWFEYFKNHNWETYPDTIKYIIKHINITPSTIIEYKNDYIDLNFIPKIYKTEELCKYALKSYKDIKHNISGVPKDLLVKKFAKHISNHGIKY